VEVMVAITTDSMTRRAPSRLSRDDDASGGGDAGGTPEAGVRRIRTVCIASSRDRCGRFREN
jgi:hypothetical protein